MGIQGTGKKATQPRLPNPVREPDTRTKIRGGRHVSSEWTTATRPSPVGISLRWLGLCLFRHFLSLLRAQRGTRQNIISIITAPVAHVPGTVLSIVPTSSAMGEFSSSYLRIYWGSEKGRKLPTAHGGPAGKGRKWDLDPKMLTAVKY